MLCNLTTAKVHDDRGGRLVSTSQTFTGIRLVDPVSGPGDRHPDSPGAAAEDMMTKFKMDLALTLDEIEATMVRKQWDYGPANIANAPGGPINGLLVRLYDKLARVENLNSRDGGPAVSDESMADTFLDIAGYGLIGLMVLNNVWPDPKKVTR